MIKMTYHINRLLLALILLAAFQPVPGVCPCLEVDHACCGTTRTADPASKTQQAQPYPSCCVDHEVDAHGCCRLEPALPGFSPSFLPATTRIDNNDPGWVVVTPHLDDPGALNQSRSGNSDYFFSKSAGFIPIFLLNLSFLC